MGRESIQQSAVSDGGHLSVDTIFELLSNSRRREALRLLADIDETTLRDLSEQIAAIENGIDRGALSSAQRKRVAIGLYQCHLPKLQRAGVVNYDRDRGTIARTPLAAHVDPYLALAANHGAIEADGSGIEDSSSDETGDE